MVHAIAEHVPEVGKAAFIAWNAEVAGAVTLGAESSVWFSATVRADLAPIAVGDRTNVQDNATLHVDRGAPLSVGAEVTIGHHAVLHGCTVGDGCLIGMGAVVLTGAVIGAESIVGAMALVTERAVFPPRSLILGSPAKVVRALDDAAVRAVRQNAETYLGLAREASRSYRALPEPP